MVVVASDEQDHDLCFSMHGVQVTVVSQSQMAHGEFDAVLLAWLNPMT